MYDFHSFIWRFVYSRVMYKTWNNFLLLNNRKLFTGSLIWAMDTFFSLYFHFCLDLTLKTWAKAYWTLSLWLHHTHSLVSFQWSGLSDQRMLPLTENCLQCLMVPLCPIVLTRVRNGSTSAYQGFSTAREGSHHAYFHTNSPIPPLC